MSGHPLHPYTHAQLCRVHNQPGMSMGVGTILARRGAWQHKSVVTHVYFTGTREQEFTNGSTTYYQFVVGVEYLGCFFADGRITLAKQRPSRFREFTVEIAPHSVSGDEIHIQHGLGGYDGGLVPVVPAPFPDSKTIKVVKKKKVSLQEQVAAAAPSPEAILAQFQA